MSNTGNVLALLLIAGLISLQSAGASDRRTECVGRLKFQLPSNFEVASVPYSALNQKLTKFEESSGFEFFDRDSAEYAHILYVGPMVMSEELSEDQIRNSIRIFADDRRKKFAESRKDFRPYKLVGEVAQLRPDFHAWTVGREVRLLYRVKNRLFFARVNDSDVLAENIERAKIFSEHVKARVNFLPEFKSGICLPGLFVDSHDMAELGEISVAYKLKAHPEITVLVSDRVPRAQENSAQEQGRSPRWIINNFWGQELLDPDILKIEPAFLGRNGRTIRLAGQSGLASYVKIFRKDGIVDYGYYAASHGDPKNAETADISIYVMMNGKYASKVNDARIDSEAFLKMTLTLQESVSFMTKDDVR